ncbi:MAG TPA: hypothetical protein PKA70_23485, partial [Saprospiraceae bacterium]|nr:hypothetical protein [Saprospiraceae bacterium]
YSIPVKMRDNNYVPGTGSYSIYYNRLDLRIAYNDLYGNMALPIVDHNLIDATNTSIQTSSEDIYIISQKTLTQTPSILITEGTGRLFEIKTTLPLEPTQGGSMAFDIEYFRLEYSSTGECCQAPVIDGTFTINEPFPCQLNTDKYISIEGAYLDGNNWHYPVYFRSTGGDPIALNQLLVEIELESSGDLGLDVLATRNSINPDACPGSCSAGGGIPNNNCIDVYQVDGKWRIAYGYCQLASPVFEQVLFEIVTDAAYGCLSDFRIVRAQWEDNIANQDAYCVFDFGKSFSDRETKGKVQLIDTGCPIAATDVCMIAIASPDCSCLTEGGCEERQTTDAEGFFASTSYCRQAADTKMRACKEDDILAYVSTYDLFRMSQALLGVAPFTEPWQVIAADVNASGGVTTLDLIELRKIILSIEDDFPDGGPAWRFIPCGHEIEGVPPSGLTIDYSNINSVVCLSPGSAPCFEAIKIGNVTSDACVVPEPQGQLVINLENGTVESNYYNLLLEPQGFTNIAAFQFALRYENTKLDFSSLHQEDLIWVDNDIKHDVPTEPNLLNFSWYGEDGSQKSLINNQEMMRLRFQKIQSQSDYRSGFSLDESELPARAWLADGTPL